MARALSLYASKALHAVGSVISLAQYNSTVQGSFLSILKDDLCGRSYLSFILHDKG